MMILSSNLIDVLTLMMIFQVWEPLV